MSLRLDQTTIQTAKEDVAFKVHNQSLHYTFPICLWHFRN